MNELKQFKSRSDLKEIIEKLEKHFARPVNPGNHPTIYKDSVDSKYRTVMGVRINDYKFSPDEKWVLPDDQMGLSFSSTWKNLKDVHRLMTRGTDKAGLPKVADIYWVLQGADIPVNMKFVEDRDPKKNGHYFLTVTRMMKVSMLVSNLKWIADRMSVIKDGGRAI